MPCTTRFSASSTANRKNAVLSVARQRSNRRACTAVTGGHFDLQRFAAFRAVGTEYGKTQDIAADHRNAEFDRQQQHDLRHACTAGQHNGHRLVGGSQKDGDQCRGAR